MGWVSLTDTAPSFRWQMLWTILSNDFWHTWHLCLIGTTLNRLFYPLMHFLLPNQQCQITLNTSYSPRYTTSKILTLQLNVVSATEYVFRKVARNLLQENSSLLTGCAGMLTPFLICCSSHSCSWSLASLWLSDTPHIYKLILYKLTHSSTYHLSHTAELMSLFAESSIY